MTNIRNTPVFTVLLIILAGLSGLLGGCFKSSPLDLNYYVLAAPPEDNPTSERGLATGPRLGILPISLPAYLQRSQMVLRQDNSVDVIVDDHNRWGEDLDLGIARVLGISVSNKLRAVNGIAAPLRTGVPEDYRLQVEIRRFEGRPGGQAALEAAWRIQLDGEAVKDGNFAGQQSAGGTIASLVTAQSALVEQLGRDIADGMIAVWAAKAN